jgi:hypothetical protein
MPDSTLTALPIVAYASKSTADPHDSISGQLETVDVEVGRQHDDAERFTFAGPFFEENRSGFHGDRGPELEAALKAAELAADEYGAAELWVWRSDRLGRGSGKKGEARSLLEVFTRCKRAGVTLRSATDDAYVQDEMTIGMASKMAEKYSADLSVAVAGGKQRRVRERGKTNSAFNFGYRLADPNAKVTERIQDEREVAALRHIGEMCKEGEAFSRMRDWLNDNGFTTGTKRGGPWRAMTTRELLERPYYCGLLKLPDGTYAQGVHEPVWTFGEFADIQLAVRKLRKPSGGRKPNVVHLFSGGVLVCDGCGKGIRYRTRSKEDRLVCQTRMEGQPCPSCNVRAHKAEVALLEHFGTVFVNLQELIAAQAGHQQEQRSIFVGQLERAMEARADLDRKVAKLEARYVDLVAEDDDQQATLVARQIGKLGEDRDKLAERIAAAEAQLEEFDGAADADEVLDWWSNFSRSIRDDVVGAKEVADANAALKRHFKEIRVITSEGQPARFDFVLKSAPPGRPQIESTMWLLGDNEDAAMRWPSEGREESDKLVTSP